MKKIYLFLCIIFLASCSGVETSVFSNNATEHKSYYCYRPFVVHKMERFDEYNSRYTTNNVNNFFSESLSGNPSFIAKNGLFIIGDTVIVNKK